VVVAGWRYTLARTWVREKDKPTEVLERPWDQVKLCKIAVKIALLDRYFFTVPVMKWLQSHQWPFLIPAVIRGRKPKPGTKAKGLRACRSWKAGSHDYTHRSGSDSVDIRLAITYASYRHRQTKKRGAKKLLYATWKVRLSPTEVREKYRRRFGIETSYRQLNQSRSRTPSRDPLDRLLLVGLSLFLRNLWQWLVSAARRSKDRCKKNVRDAEPTKPTRYQDMLDEYSEYLRRAYAL
jgi:hypothetical protein